MKRLLLLLWLVLAAISTASGQSYGPLPYLQLSDSPLVGGSHVYFYVEDFEDGVLNTPGLTLQIPPGGSAVNGPGPNTDSVDFDAARPGSALNGSGEDGSAMNYSGTDGDLIGTFSAAALGGQLPTEVGLVWTDGVESGNFTLRVYDKFDQLIGSVSGPVMNDGSFAGGTAEDRFFGFRGTTGIKRFEFGGVPNGIEIDHIQYGLPVTNVLAPIITQQPQSLTVTQGQDATFGLQVLGREPLVGYWVFNSIVKTQPAWLSFTVTNAQLSDAGDYFAIVSNDFGAVTSQVATLTLLHPDAQGTITCVDGSPLANCPVTVKFVQPGVTTLSQSTVTGSSGNFSVSFSVNGLVSGSYFVVSSACCPQSWKVPWSGYPWGNLGTLTCGSPPYGYVGGKVDDFKATFETAFPSACLQSVYLGQNVTWKNFDDPAINRWVGHTFVGLPAGILKAELRIRMKPECDIESNDSILLGLLNHTASGPCSGAAAWAWSQSIINLPEANGSWNCANNAKTIFTLDLSALGAVNLLGKLNADKFLDVAVQDDSTVDFVTLRVWTCPPPKFFFGLPHEPLGQATLAASTNGQVVLGNLGPSGSDGVEIALGRAQGWEALWERPDDPPDGASLLFETSAMQDTGRVTAVSASAHRVGSEIELAVSMPLASTPLKTIELYREGKLLHRVEGVTDSLVAKVLPQPGLNKPKWPKDHHVFHQVYPVHKTIAQWTYSEVFTGPWIWTGTNPTNGTGTTGDSPPAMLIPGMTQPLLADTVTVISDTVLPELSFSHATLRAQGIPSLAFQAEQIRQFGLPFAAISNVALQPSEHGISCINTGGDSDDDKNGSGKGNIIAATGKGLAIGLGPSLSYSLDLAPIDPDNTASNGANLVSQSYGSLSGTPHRKLDELTATKDGANVVFEADFKPLGSGSQSVKLLLASNLVASFTGQTGIVGVATAWPSSLGAILSSNHTRCVKFSEPARFTLRDQVFTADELQVSAENATNTVGYMAETQLGLGALGEITVNDVSAVSLPRPTLNVAAGTGAIVLSWSSPACHLQSAPNVTGPWSNIPAASPVTLPAVGPNKYFRLLCP